MEMEQGIVRLSLSFDTACSGRLMAAAYVDGFEDSSHVDLGSKVTLERLCH